MYVYLCYYIAEKVCKDLHASCKSYASRGRCKSKEVGWQDWMAENCIKSCSLSEVCEGSSKDVSRTSKDDFASRENQQLQKVQGERQQHDDKLLQAELESNQIDQNVGQQNIQHQTPQKLEGNDQNKFKTHTDEFNLINSQQQKSQVEENDDRSKFTLFLENNLVGQQNVSLATVERPELRQRGNRLVKSKIVAQNRSPSSRSGHKISQTKHLKKGYNDKFEPFFLKNPLLKTIAEHRSKAQITKKSGWKLKSKIARQTAATTPSFALTSTNRSTKSKGHSITITIPRYPNRKTLHSTKIPNFARQHRGQITTGHRNDKDKIQLHSEAVTRVSAKHMVADAQSIAPNSSPSPESVAGVWERKLRVSSVNEKVETDESNEQIIEIRANSNLKAHSNLKRPVSSPKFSSQRSKSNNDNLKRNNKSNQVPRDFFNPIIELSAVSKASPKDDVLRLKTSLSLKSRLGINRYHGVPRALERNVPVKPEAGSGFVLFNPVECEDKIPQCHLYIADCPNAAWKISLRRNCAKTCGVC